MLGALLPAAISAASSLFGGFLGNQQRAEGQNKEIELQKEFAQNGLRWKVEDAQRAGIHPLAALGSVGAQYSPVGLGDNDTAASFASAGQDFSRAIDATRTLPEQGRAIGGKMAALGLERASLENDLLRAQILDITRPGQPPFPMAGSDYNVPGQPGSGVKVFGIDMKPHEGFSDASVIQDRQGELAENIYSPFIMGADALKTAEGAISDHLRDTQKAGARRPSRGAPGSR